jgi:uncharacterized membrane protein (UPF0127 family)
MDFKVRIGGKNFLIEKVRQVNFFQGVKGLMFSKREDAQALLFNSKSSIHSFFCFFPFWILWLDSNDVVVDFKLVIPWRFRVDCKKSFSKFIEIPVNRRYNSIVNNFINLSSEKDLKIKDH